MQRCQTNLSSKINAKKHYIIHTKLTVYDSLEDGPAQFKSLINISPNEKYVKMLIEYDRPTRPSENTNDYILADLYLLFEN